MTPQKKTDAKHDALTDAGVTVAARQRPSRNDRHDTAKRTALKHNQSQSGTHASEQRQNTTSDERFTDGSHGTPRTATTYARNELDARKALTIR